MLTFSALGKKGRLGNSMFQIASIIGLARLHKQGCVFPTWEFAQYFRSENYFGGNLTGFTEYKEKHYHFHDWQFEDGVNYDLNGWLQTAKYWERSPESFAAVKDAFTFKPEIIEDLASRYPDHQEAICISIRRGDFVNNPNYYQLPITYYLLALTEVFPDWQSRKLYIFSDDLDYCRHHFDSASNAIFIDEPPILQLALGSLCRTFIISNSTFSYWLAYLAELQQGKESVSVIRPLKNMTGKLAFNSDEKDYWPDNWTIYNHENKKFDLTDTTFTCPLYYDHEDRRNNANLSICMLQRYFDTNVIVGEQGGEKFRYFQQWAKYMNFPKTGHFHRTKMLNDMAYEATTPFVVNWDIDTVLPPLRIWLSVEALRNGAEIVYPFDGRVYHVPRVPNFGNLERSLDTGIFGLNTFIGKNGAVVTSSVGHAVFVNKESFILAGMENEKFISYGPEDCERFDRFKLLGLSLVRIDGPMYHLEHWRGKNSNAANPFFKANTELLNKQRCLTADQLRFEISTWQWVKKYTEAYYGRIMPGAIESAKYCFAALAEIGIKPESVIDIGCGCGEWSKGSSADYYGIDRGIIQRALIFDFLHYADFDLNKTAENWPLQGKRFDLALCLEVAEHLHEKAAEPLIKALCAYSDKVFFGAAIPGQGGHDHINEQWQTYWADLFAKQGFYPAKKQPDIKDNSKIEVWYRQNAILYVKGAKGGKVERFVHPDMWSNHFKIKK